jgi:hypothetical protein
MELKHIDLARLSVSALNMRGTKKSCDIANILPSVRARGVLVSLIVREMIAGEGGSGSKVGGGGALSFWTAGELADEELGPAARQIAGTLLRAYSFE